MNVLDLLGLEEFIYPVQDGGANPRDDRDGVVEALVPSLVVRELMSQAATGWDPYLRLEYCKMCIRTACNSAVSNSKAQLREEERAVNDNLNHLMAKLS